MAARPRARELVPERQVEARVAAALRARDSLRSRRHDLDSSVRLRRPFCRFPPWAIRWRAYSRCSRRPWI